MASLTRMCWICGKAVSIEDCKTDEHGNAVHGKCYAAKVSSRYEEASRPWRQIARELASETNSNRVFELSQELNEALLKQGMDARMEGFGGQKTDARSGNFPSSEQQQKSSAKS